MATIPGISQLLALHFLTPSSGSVLAPHCKPPNDYRLPDHLRPTQCCDRLDWADQKELVEARRLPNVPATLQPAYPELIEAARVREGRFLPAGDDFADRFHERRQELARWQPAASNAMPRTSPADFSDLVWTARTIQARFAPWPEDPPVAEVVALREEPLRLNNLLSLSVLLLLWRNNPIQFPAGSRLDLLV